MKAPMHLRNLCITVIVIYILFYRHKVGLKHKQTLVQPPSFGGSSQLTTQLSAKENMKTFSFGKLLRFNIQFQHRLFSSSN